MLCSVYLHTSTLPFSGGSLRKAQEHNKDIFVCYVVFTQSQTVVALCVCTFVYAINYQYTCTVQWYNDGDDAHKSCRWKGGRKDICESACLPENPIRVTFVCFAECCHCASMKKREREKRWERPLL